MMNGKEIGLVRPLLSVGESELYIMISILLGGLGWGSRTLASNRKIVLRKLLAGMIFSGFVSAIGCMMLMSIGVSPLMAAPLSGMIGSMGSTGFQLLLEKFWKGEIDGPRQ